MGARHHAPLLGLLAVFGKLLCCCHKLEPLHRCNHLHEEMLALSGLTTTHHRLAHSLPRMYLGTFWSSHPTKAAPDSRRRTMDTDLLLMAMSTEVRPCIAIDTLADRGWQ